MGRCALYCRVSTAGQAEAGTSLQSQTEACRRYAAQHHYTVVREIQEDATGANLDRRGLQELRDLARAGHIDALICYTPDRLSRDLVDMYLVKQELERAGCTLLFVTVPKDDSPFGEAMLGMTAVMGKLERKLIQVRTKQGKDQRALNGEIIGSWMVPYGYSCKDRKYVVEEEQASVVRRIFTWIAYEGESMHGVARRLHALGIPTQRGGQWRPATLRLMLANSVYMGQAVWNRRRKTGKAQEDRITIPVPAIVSTELWDKANQQVAQNRRTYWRETKAEYLLSGVLVCAHCTRVYAAMSDFRKSQAGYGVYRCPMRWRGEYREEGRKCQSRTYNKRVLESMVWAALVTYLSSEAPQYPPQDALSGHQRHDASTVDVVALQKSLEACEREKVRVMDAYRVETYSLLELQSQLEIIRDKRAAIERELSRAQSVPAYTERDRRTIDDLRAFLQEHGQELSFAHKKRIVQASGLRVIAGGNSLALYALPDPDRAFSVLVYEQS